LDARNFAVQQKFNPRVDRERGVPSSPANRLNCTGSSQEILKCLRNLDVSSFVVQQRFNPRDVPFLPDHPLRLLTNGQFNRVPLIIGVNTNEGAFIVAGSVK
jgi:carboxylesterase type B